MSMMNHSPRARSRRAIGLIEVMVAMVLLEAFLVISTELYVSVFRAQREYHAREQLIARIDNIIDVLRRDVWAAASTRATGERLELATPSGSIVWQMSADGTLTRSAPGLPPQNWSPLPRLSFAAAGPLVTLKAAGVEGKRDEEMTLVSERLLGQTQAASAGGRL